MANFISIRSDAESDLYLIAASKIISASFHPDDCQNPTYGDDPLEDYLDDNADEHPCTPEEEEALHAWIEQDYLDEVSDLYTEHGGGTLTIVLRRGILEFPCLAEDASKVLAAIASYQNGNPPIIVPATKALKLHKSFEDTADDADIPDNDENKIGEDSYAD